jgi:hypothetical protein
MNFKHLHYFWVTARAGGVVKAGEQLHTTPQTLSGQIKLLEDRLGRHLFRKNGRRLELTEDGRVALRYADEIFHLGSELEQAMREKREGPKVLDFRVGIADAVPKTMAYRLLEPALDMADPIHVICHEGKLPDLLGSSRCTGSTWCWPTSRCPAASASRPSTTSSARRRSASSAPRACARASRASSRAASTACRC